MQIFRLPIPGILVTFLVLQPALFFQQFGGIWVMEFYKLVVVMFGSDPELAPSTKKYCFSVGKSMGLVSRGIVTTVLRETRKLSGCFKIKNLQPFNTNIRETKVSRGPNFNKLKRNQYFCLIFNSKTVPKIMLFNLVAKNYKL